MPSPNTIAWHIEKGAYGKGWVLCRSCFTEHIEQHCVSPDDCCELDASELDAPDQRCGYCDELLISERKPMTRADWDEVKGDLDYHEDREEGR
jgi:hypothetical protein